MDLFKKGKIIEKVIKKLYKKIDNFCKEKELSRSQLLQLAIDKLEEDETK